MQNLNIISTLARVITNPFAMKKLGLFLGFIFATTCSVYGVTIRHATESPTDNQELSLQEICDTTVTVIERDESEKTDRVRSRYKSADAEHLPYTPLLELGKEWRYNLFHPNVDRPKEQDRKRVLRAEDVVEVDGKSVYILTMYDENGMKIEKESGRMWEDCENRKVYIDYQLYDGTPYTDMIYDFANPVNTPTEMKISYLHEAVWSEYTTLDGEKHNRYNFRLKTHPIIEDFQLVEGLGFITSEDYEQDINRHCVGTILESALMIRPIDGFISKLYEVVNGDGEVIYSLETARPGYTSINAAGISGDSVVVDGSSIKINGTEQIGVVSVFNPMGALVKEENISGVTGDVSTTDLAPGVYVVRTSKICKKFVVK